MATAPQTDLILAGTPVPHHGPWPRVAVGPQAWEEAAELLANGRSTLLGLWGDSGFVHMALADAEGGDIGVFSLECPDGRFPSVGRHHPPALRLERAARDLFGLQPEGSPDTRPWLDHGAWGVCHPLKTPADPPLLVTPYAFLGAEGEGLHQIPVGPVHAGIIEPGHFRFTANGETVVRLEERLGYVHKGIEGLIANADLERAARLAGRVSGDSTAAYAFCFARAVETAWQVEVPPRAVWLRALMAEMERLANHLGDIGAICNDASFALMHAHCGILRERVLRAADQAFGHRLMRDRIVPGGVALDIAEGGTSAVRALIKDVQSVLPALVEFYDNTTSLRDRTVATGVLSKALAQQYGAGGYVGRASGRAVDARKRPGYPPYDELTFTVPVREAGDVDTRVWIRFDEVKESLSLIAQILERLPDGSVRVDLRPPSAPREGMAMVEGFRGDILVWLRMGAEGRVKRCHLRDPSWFQWPLLEAVVEGNIVADFPLCNKSFNCSYSGHDL